MIQTVRWRPTRAHAICLPRSNPLCSTFGSYSKAVKNFEQFLILNMSDAKSQQDDLSQGWIFSLCCTSFATNNLVSMFIFIYFRALKIQREFFFPSFSFKLAKYLFMKESPSWTKVFQHVFDIIYVYEQKKKRFTEFLEIKILFSDLQRII